MEVPPSTRIHEHFLHQLPTRIHEHFLHQPPIRIHEHFLPQPPTRIHEHFLHQPPDQDLEDRPFLRLRLCAPPLTPLCLSTCTSVHPERILCTFHVPPMRIPSLRMCVQGLDFSAADCDASHGCNQYVQMALTTLVDVPGYLVGSVLADVVGRRRAASLSLLVGGSCLLLMAALDPTGGLATALRLVGKLGAASGFVLAYLFPAELFPTAIRTSALGVANLFARTGTVLVPLLATAPPMVVHVALGSVGAFAGLSTLLLPERRGLALPDATSLR